MSNPKVVWAAAALLGESPVWHAPSQCLFFVDIKRPAIHAWYLDGTHQSYPVPSEIGCIVATQRGGLVAAMRTGLARVQLAPTFTLDYFATIEANIPGNRPNDGKCDPAGRFWLASMDMAEQNARGRIWRIDHQTTCMGQGHIIGNGFGWSPDGSVMYFTDSVQRVIYAYPFDLASGGLGERRCFASVPPDAGYPDGLAVDAQGFVWSAHWDGWRITRYRPDGQIDRVVPMPVPRPTSVAFGGIALDRLYVTSASIGLDTTTLAQAPLSGSLFELDVGVSGCPVASFAG